MNGYVFILFTITLPGRTVAVFIILIRSTDLIWIIIIYLGLIAWWRTNAYCIIIWLFFSDPNIFCLISSYLVILRWLWSNRSIVLICSLSRSLIARTPLIILIESKISGLITTWTCIHLFYCYFYFIIIVIIGTSIRRISIRLIIICMLIIIFRCILLIWVDQELMEVLGGQPRSGLDHWCFGSITWLWIFI